MKTVESMNEKTKEQIISNESWKMLGDLSVPCIHCGKTSAINEYFHTMTIRVSAPQYYIPMQYLLECPHCDKEMRLLSMEFGVRISREYYNDIFRSFMDRFDTMGEIPE